MPLCLRTAQRQRARSRGRTPASTTVPGSAALRWTYPMAIGPERRRDAGGGDAPDFLALGVDAVAGRAGRAPAAGRAAACSRSRRAPPAARSLPGRRSSPWSASGTRATRAVSWSRFSSVTSGPNQGRPSSMRSTSSTAGGSGTAPADSAARTRPPSRRLRRNVEDEPSAGRSPARATRTGAPAMSTIACDSGGEVRHRAARIAQDGRRPAVRRGRGPPSSGRAEADGRGDAIVDEQRSPRPRRGRPRPRAGSRPCPPARAGRRAGGP